VVWLFQGVLEAPQEFGCNTSLPPGPYRNAFAPAHLAYLRGASIFCF